MVIKRFEEIKAWQEARILVNMVFKAIKNSEVLAKSYKLRDQLISSAISSMANIAEGFSRRSSKEFAQFLFVSKGSISEVQCYLYVALDQGMISESKFNEIYLQADKVARYVSSFISYLIKSKERGTQ